MLDDRHSKALVLKGPFKDLSDVLRIARHQGKKILKCNKVRVDPHISYKGPNTLIVLVKAEVNYLWDEELI